MSVLAANRRKISSTLQLGVSLVLLALLFSLIDLHAFLDLMAGIQPTLFVAGLLLYFLALGVQAVRWHYILEAADEEVGVLKLIEINLIGSFFSNFLPTAVGGDLARMYETSRKGIMGTKAVSTVLLDRVIGLLSLIIISLIALTVGYRYIGEQNIIYAVFGTTLSLFIAWLLFFNQRLMRRFKWLFKLPLIKLCETSARQLYYSLYEFHNRPKLLVSTLSISFIAQGIEISSAVLVASSIGVQPQVFFFFIFVPLIWLVTMLPVTLNGIGLRESTFVFFFGQIGVASTEAVAVSLMLYTLRLLAGLVGGVLFMRSSVLDSFKKLFKRNQTPI